MIRMRIRFATDESVKYVGHLDLARAWERALRRARLPLTYSQGFNRQPRVQFAAALPVGFTGEAEIVDVYLDEEIEPEALLPRLTEALPEGIRPLNAEPILRDLPSLQSQVCGAIYRVEVETNEPDELFQAQLNAFVARREAWRKRRRGDRIVPYDLRPLVESVHYLGRCDLGQAFEVRMRSEPGATGRPDELLAELGLEAAPRRIARAALITRE